METFSLPAPSGASGALLDPASKSLSPSTPLILPSSAGPVQIRQLSVSATTHSARARARSFTDICLSHNAHCTHALAHAMINTRWSGIGAGYLSCEWVCVFVFVCKGPTSGCAPLPRQVVGAVGVCVAGLVHTHGLSLRGHRCRGSGRKAK